LEVCQADAPGATIMEHSTPVYFDTNQAAKKIKRTPGAGRSLVARRLIPFRKPGGRLLFLEHELEAWIERAPGLRIEDME